MIFPTLDCQEEIYLHGITGLLPKVQGVKEVVQNTLTDFELTMALAGCKQISEINRDSLSNK